MRDHYSGFGITYLIGISLQNECYCIHYTFQSLEYYLGYRLQIE